MKAPLIHLFQRYCITPGLYGFYRHLYKLSLRGMGILNAEGSVVTGETWLQQHIHQSSCRVSTIVDVGANTGGYAAQLAHQFPQANIFCHEPNPETYQLLQQTAQRFPNMSIYPYALSHENGQTKLYDYADTAPLKSAQPTATMASLHKDVIKELHQQPAKAYSVTKITLDTWAQEHAITSIDWLKIDTEGHELAVLKGAKQLISQQAIHLIQFEFNEMNVYSRTFFRDFKKILQGYNVYRLLPRGWISLTKYRPLTHEIYGFQNIVAIAPRWHKKVCQLNVAER